MLISFSFENFYSFKDEQEFSMIASNRKELFNCEENVCSIGEDLELLKSAVIYGANASGKSNLLKAFDFFKNLIFRSIGDNVIIGFLPFLLNKETQLKNAWFELSFFLKNKIYRYGFELSKDEIIEEWLYVKEQRESKVFYRKKDDIEITDKYKILLELKNKKMVRKNSLLLNLAAQFNDPTCNEIINWFLNFNVISGIDDRLYKNYTNERILDPQVKAKALSLLQVADFGIEEIDLEITNKTKEPVLSNDKKTPISKPDYNLLSTRNVLNTEGIVIDSIKTPFEYFESEGTKKFYHLLGPILNTLETGKVLVIDEFDVKLHPLLTQRLVKLFNSEINVNNAQLIFATQDTHLLDGNLFRRDQIWFTEKDKFGVSHLYPLTDFKPRNDENLEKNYIAGKYGAIPFLGDFYALFETNKFKKDNVKE